MPVPTRLTSEDSFILVLDPAFVRVVAGQVEYDLSAAAAAGVASFAGRVGAVVPEAGDYSAAQVTYGGGDVAAGLAAAQASADVLAVLGATLRRAASGATVHVLAIGT